MSNPNLKLVAFHLPMKPFTVIDTINRRAAATGSMRYAMAASSADYNGHSNNLTWNDYRGYYVGEYYYGERVVFARGPGAVSVVQAALNEFARQGRGAALSITVLTKDADAVRAEFPQLIEGEEPKVRSWWSWRHAVVGDAVRSNQTHLLLRARDAEHYKRLCGEFQREDGGWDHDPKLAASEWQAIKNEPVNPEVNFLP